MYDTNHNLVEYKKVLYKPIVSGIQTSKIESNN